MIVYCSSEWLVLPRYNEFLVRTRLSLTRDGYLANIIINNNTCVIIDQARDLINNTHIITNNTRIIINNARIVINNTRIVTNNTLMIRNNTRIIRRPLGFGMWKQNSLLRKQ